jgi:Uma2 family endonuclease
MAMTSDQLPMITRADWVPGPGQENWTYDNYCTLSDGRRYEIVNGVLYLIPTPWVLHQRTVGEMFIHLFDYVTSTHLGRVVPGPLDVELAPNVVLQSDILVVLHSELGKITDTHFIGAPDLVIEVSSPGTIGYERREKQDAYARGGVPEYWIVDPDSRTVEVLILEGGEYLSQGVYRGKATLPSQIVPGLLVHVEQYFVSVWKEDGKENPA